MEMEARRAGAGGKGAPDLRGRDPRPAKGKAKISHQPKLICLLACLSACLPSSSACLPRDCLLLVLLLRPPWTVLVRYCIYEMGLRWDGMGWDEMG